MKRPSNYFVIIFFFIIAQIANAQKLRLLEWGLENEEFYRESPSGSLRSGHPWIKHL